MVYLYFTAMDKSEIRHMLYILPLDLLPNTHSHIENYIKCNCVCSVCIREIILVLFFYRICKLIYILEDNKLCFVIPFTVYQSLTFQFHVWNHRGKIYLQNQPKLIKITKYYPGSVLATGSPWQQLISVPLPVVFCPVQTY